MPSDSETLDRARRLGPDLRARSEEIERARSLPDDIVNALVQAGLFKFWAPEDVGGAEISACQGLDVITELARHDTSVAWCVFIANTTALTAGRLSPEWAHAIYDRPDAITGGFAAPVGRARSVEGGLVVSGRWQWGSGTQHCTTVGGGVLLVDDDGNPAPRADGLIAPFVFMDASDVTFLDTWHVLGVRGSGSTDYEAHDVFVPEGRWVGLTDATPTIDRPLFRLSFFGMLGAGIACTAIGIADRAIEEYRTLALAKVPQGSGRTLAERTSAQTDIARAEATVRSASAFLHEVFDDAWRTAASGADVSIEQRRLLRLAITDATQRCSDAVSRLHRSAGGEAVYERNPLERLFRDANVVSQHAMAAERTYEMSGRLTFGLETNTSTL